MMQKEKMTIIERWSTDGVVTSEQPKTCMVYTLKDGRKQANDFRGGRKTLKVEGDTLVLEFSCFTVRKTSLSEIFG